MLTKLSDETVSELLNRPTLKRIENLLPIEERHEIIKQIQGWSKHHELDINSPIEILEEKLSILLGSSPNFHQKFKERAIVWGFDFNKSKFAPHNQLILSAEENGIGIQISVHEKFRKNMLLDLLQEINDKLQG